MSLTTKGWRLRALPAEIVVWWDDRIEGRPIPTGKNYEHERAHEARRVAMVGEIRLQSARTLAAVTADIAAYLVNSTLQLDNPVRAAQFPTGVGQYVNYPLEPPMPVQIHVVSKLPDARGQALSSIVDYLAFAQARLLHSWFNDQAKEGRSKGDDFYRAAEISAFRSTLWIAGERRDVEIDPAQGTILDSYGWPEGYQFPSLHNPTTG